MDNFNRGWGAWLRHEASKLDTLVAMNKTNAGLIADTIDRLTAELEDAQADFERALGEKIAYRDELAEERRQRMHDRQMIGRLADRAHTAEATIDCLTAELKRLKKGQP